jgi:hypothetical protein
LSQCLSVAQRGDNSGALFQYFLSVLIERVPIFAFNINRTDDVFTLRIKYRNDDFGLGASGTPLDNVDQQKRRQHLLSFVSDCAASQSLRDRKGRKLRRLWSGVDDNGHNLCGLINIVDADPRS